MENMVGGEAQQRFLLPKRKHELRSIPAPLLTNVVDFEHCLFYWKTLYVVFSL